MFLNPGMWANHAAIRVPAGGGGTPTLTYMGSVTPSFAGQVATATGANIGTAAADRLVVVVFAEASGSSETSATVTIGGNSATVHDDIGSLSAGAWHCLPGGYHGNHG